MINIRNFRGLTKDEMEVELAKTAGGVKLMLGCCNNVAYAIMMNALDKVKQHPAYRHEVKKAFLRALDQWKFYENRLMNAVLLRFFHVDDMTPEVRKKYRDNITDYEYYEMWTGVGGAAYTMTQSEINSLRHKYDLSLIKHNVKHHEIAAEVMVAMAGLELSCKIYRSYMHQVMLQTGLDSRILQNIFFVFSLDRVAKAWREALEKLTPECFKYDLDEMDERNLEWGLVQLEQKWTDIPFVYGAVRKATEDFPEVFRTKGEQRKELLLISKLLDESINNSKQQTT